MSLFKGVSVAYLYVRDLGAARKWYEGVLGWPLALGNDAMGWYEYAGPSGAHVAINQVQPGGLGPGAGGTTAVLLVDDAAETLQWLKDRGVRCDELLVIPGVVKIGTFFDPDGNRLQFSQTLFPV